jgi:hypothetical protein
MMLPEKERVDMSKVLYRSRLFRFAGLRGRALSRGGHSALPRLCLGYTKGLGL